MTTTSRRIFYTLATAIFIVLSLLELAPGAAADYTVNVTDNGVRVQISGELLQAVPNPPSVNSSFSFGPIPAFKLHLVGTNASSLSSHLNAALREKTPTAVVTQVTLDSRSNGTIYNYILSFDVEGISATHGDVEALDLSWRSFAIKDDINAGNYSVNLVLADYLESNVLVLAALPVSSGPPIARVRRWYWNNRLIDNQAVGPTMSNAQLFNFSSLKAPLQQWITTPDIAGRAFRYEATTGFNLTFHEQITEIEEIANLITNAVYKVKAVVEAPWGTVATVDTLQFEAKTPWSTWIMISVIVITIGLTAGTYLLERRSRDAKRDREHRRQKK